MKIAVLASGGVDSSVALKLLQAEGHDLTAFYLKIWLEDELQYLGNCPWEDDLNYLKQICEEIKIPLRIIPMQKEYWENVVDYALAEIKAGRTPNSDLLCNSKIKFGKFYEKIDDSYDLVASGHYANQETIGKNVYLTRAKDKFKDQTYFLAHLNQKQLKRAIFPLGKYLKSEVRTLAKQFNLPNQNRKDSQGICFLGQIKYKEFVKHHLGIKKGDLIDFDTGKKIGEHQGYWFYTIGQRKGIELSGGPWFVVKKDIDKNIIYISNQYYQDKPRNTFEVEKLHWIGSIPTTEQLNHLEVKIRHGEKLYPAKLDFQENNQAHIEINESDQGIAPGQFAVFYSGKICLGVGTIK
ncbi:tRNA 2-thiouridine(34) synthase MnmA [Candidatus Peregrinibacteria bacterium]|nr:tRNA 2-thiouridine(34) synthase MnmA [Candidatus Peregrinibacteria bacterium]